MPQQSQKNVVGSIYFNVPKDAPQDTRNKLFNVFQWLKDNKIYMGLSFGITRLKTVEPDANGYLGLTAFPNTFKKSNDKNSHFYVVPRESKGKSRQQKPQEAAALKPSSDGLPF